MSYPKVIIIGIDGADPDLFQMWKQDLPALRQLADGGMFGPLRSSIPPITVPAWYVFATGKQPGNLGVFGFAQRTPGSYNFTFANLACCSARTLWDYLGDAGLRVGVFNLPGTYPPEAMNGFLVCSSISAPPNDGKLIFTYPSDLSRKLDQLVGGYELASPHTATGDNEAIVTAERRRVHRKHSEALFTLARDEPWDVLIAVFDITDRMGHQTWKHFDPSHPQHDPKKSPKYANAIRQAYIAVDQEIERLLSLAGGDAVAIIMSDHGFGPQHKTFHVNEWLRQSGFLITHQDYAASRRNPIRRVNSLLAQMNEQSTWFRRLSKPFRGSSLAARVRADRNLLQSRIPLSSVSVDWTRTLAYSCNHHAIQVNLRGREPQGIVDPGAPYDQLVQKIATKLEELRDPSTGRPAVSRVLRREEAYRGKHLAEAPDIMVFMEEIYCTAPPTFAPNGFFELEPDGTGHHRNYGVLLIHGPGIRQGKIVSAGLADLLPTVLHILDLPVPDDLDGQILGEVFDPASEYAVRAPRFVAAKEKRTSDFAYTEADKDAITEHLRGLGYL